VVVVWAAGAAVGPPQAAAPLPNGGSLLRIRGAGLSPVSQLVLTIGGVAVEPFSVDLGALAHAPVGAAGGPPNGTAFPDGTAAHPARLRAAPEHVLLVCAPPGLGTVSVIARMGGRFATTTLTYAAASLDGYGSDHDPATTASSGLRFTANLAALPACALCFSSFDDSTGVVAAQKFSTRLCGATRDLFDYADAPSAMPPTTALRCPFLTDSQAVQLTASMCAFPDELWRTQASTCAAGFVPLGAFSTVDGVATRCASSLPLFTARAELSGSRAAIESASFSPNGDRVRLKTSADIGTLTVTVNANVSYVVVSGGFSKAELLGRLPQVRSLDIYDWPPMGGLTVTANVLNGAPYGSFVVACPSYPALPFAWSRPPCCARTTRRSFRHNSKAVGSKGHWCALLLSARSSGGVRTRAG
jgi:hypothetical protein